MKNSEIITEKIDELIALSALEGEVNSQIVLLALQGARKDNIDGVLAEGVGLIIKNILLPICERQREKILATYN